MGSTIFAPNLTGKLHMGHAMVLWVTAREARERGLDLLIRLDDVPPPVENQRHADFTEIVKMQTESTESVLRACETLAIQPAKIYRSTQRYPRYFQVLEELRDAGLVERIDPAGHFVEGGMTLARDLLYGEIVNPSRAIMASYRFTAFAPAIIDAIDFEEELHIRGMDIATGSSDEAGLYELFRGHYNLSRDFRPYAHLPVVATEDGWALHNSRGVIPPAYFLDAFAKQFESVKALRECLERMVLPKDADYSFQDILRAYQVDVAPGGRRVKVHYQPYL